MNKHSETKTSKRAAFARDERGAGLVEYIILAGVVALVSVGAFTTFGQSVQGKIGQHGSAVTSIPSN